MDTVMGPEARARFEARETARYERNRTDPTRRDWRTPRWRPTKDTARRLASPERHQWTDAGRRCVRCGASRAEWRALLVPERCPEPTPLRVERRRVAPGSEDEAELLARLDALDKAAAARMETYFNAHRPFDPAVADEHIRRADALLARLRQAVGETFTGWKGGEYTMGAHTRLWAANPGDCTQTAIVGVTDRGWCVTIETEYAEA